MTPIINIESAAELLAALPHQLGCTPRDSLVLVPIERRATLGALRIDLPHHDNTGDVADAAIGYLLRLPHIEDVITTVWTDGPALDGDEIAYDRLVAEVSERAYRAGIRVTGELCIGSDGWTSYTEPELRPLSEIAPADPPGGATLAGHPREGAHVPRADEAEREEVVRQLIGLEEMAIDPFHRLWDDEKPDATAAEAADELRRFDDDPFAAAEAAMRESAPPPARAALWMWILRCPALRDVMLTAWVGGDEEARRTCSWQRSWAYGSEAPPDFPVRLAGEGPRPEARRIREALRFARSLVARAPVTHLPGCLAVCGWLSWALGNSTHAAEYASQALEIDERHSFAELIMAITEKGILPGWAFNAAGEDAFMRERSLLL